MTTTFCNRLGWTEWDQEADNPCECHLASGHDGLHVCGNCGNTWAGGRAPGGTTAETKGTVNSPALAAALIPPPQKEHP